MDRKGEVSGRRGSDKPDFKVKIKPERQINF